jgi:CubicO group peptidase (beta-lactamase class C family)
MFSRPSRDPIQSYACLDLTMTLWKALLSATKRTNPTQTLLRIMVLSLISASTARADKVDDYIRQAMQKRRIPGLAVAVVKGGKVIKAKGYGVANLETGTPVRPETVFELASITKTFTATGIILLVEQGKVSLDEKISNGASPADAHLGSSSSRKGFPEPRMDA